MDDKAVNALGIMAATKLRNNLNEQADAAIKMALAQGWSGRIWAWVAMSGGHGFIHVSRIEPDWPIENLIGNVSVYDVP